MADFIVTYMVPVMVRVENVGSHAEASGIANDYRIEDSLFDRIDEGLDATRFSVNRDEAWALDTLVERQNDTRTTVRDTVSTRDD
jgi:hypothetical protein